MTLEFERANPPRNEVMNIPPRLNISNLTKSPSILILTDPQVDLKGRFGQGKTLGWYKQKSDIEDEKTKLLEEQSTLSMMPSEEKDKGDKDKGKIKERRIMSIPLSSDRALAQLREQHHLPLTPISEIKKIAAYYSQKFGIPIVVSSEMGDNPNVDAMACRQAECIKIHLHPILQYRAKDYIVEAILREAKECQNFMRDQAFGWQRGR